MRAPPGELDPAKARNLALRWLTRREHSSFELHEKLIKKGCEVGLATQVVERLKAERLLSDERFIEGTISARRRRGYGPLRVRQVLEQKGIPRDSIQGWIDPRGREWIELLNEVRRKKFGSKPPKDYAERAKQARFLQSRGFTFDQIQHVLNIKDND